MGQMPDRHLVHFIFQMTARFDCFVKDDKDVANDNN